MTGGQPDSSSATPALRPLSPENENNLRRILNEGLSRPVGLDVWTRQHSGLVLPDRDPCDHCEEQLALMRQFVRIHPLLSITAYDIERHATRAAELGVDLTPATVMRSGGRSVQFVGMSDGTLLRPCVDVMAYLSAGTSPINDGPREVLATITEPIHLELLVAPYDQFSGALIRLLGAMAAEFRMLRLRIIDATEYPLFAAQRGVTEVPVLTIEGRRFVGSWNENALAEQIRRIATGDAELVPRGEAETVPFMTEQAARAEAEGAAPSTPGGLYIPGRD